ncbi:MAG TPA: hypothetical protein VFQ43_19240, partial [Nitrososphaera sp.]|nr:hypothetical protein [Nitrososphaera sp.]
KLPQYALVSSIKVEVKFKWTVSLLIVQVDFLRALGDAESLRANSHAKLPQYALRFWHRNWSVFLVIRGFLPAISCARNKD